MSSFKEVKLTETSVIGESVFIALRRSEALLRISVSANRVVTREKLCCDAGIGLRKGVSTHHTSYMTSVAWTVLYADIVSWTTDPILRVSAPISENVFVHLCRSWQIGLAGHALLKCKSSKIVRDASSDANVLIDASCGFSEEFILRWHVTCIAR